MITLSPWEQILPQTARSAFSSTKIPLTCSKSCSERVALTWQAQSPSMPFSQSRLGISHQLTSPSQVWTAPKAVYSSKNDSTTTWPASLKLSSTNSELFKLPLIWLTIIKLEYMESLSPPVCTIQADPHKLGRVDEEEKRQSNCIICLEEWVSLDPQYIQL